MFKKPVFNVGIVFVGFCLLSVSTCFAGEKDTLIVGLQDNIVSLDPAITQENVATSIMLYVYERLVTYENFDYTTPLPGLVSPLEFAGQRPVPVLCL